MLKCQTPVRTDHLEIQRNIQS